jgi:hypothetical protein
MIFVTCLTEGRRYYATRRGRVYNIKKDLDGYNVGLDWIDLVEGRERWRALLNAVVKLLSSTTDGLSKRAQLHEASTLRGSLDRDYESKFFRFKE